MSNDEQISKAHTELEAAITTAFTEAISGPELHHEFQYALMTAYTLGEQEGRRSVTLVHPFRVRWFRWDLTAGGNEIHPIPTPDDLSPVQIEPLEEGGARVTIAFFVPINENGSDAWSETMQQSAARQAALWAKIEHAQGEPEPVNLTSPAS